MFCFKTAPTLARFSCNVLRNRRLASVWANVEKGPEDPILGITIAYNKDPNPNKINLGVGAYRDDAGKPWVLPSVRRAEAELLEKKLNHEYLPIVGHQGFVDCAVQLAYGKDSQLIEDKRVAAVQALSGTGALRVAGEFIKRFAGDKTIYLPKPTWANHIPIFKDAGLQVGEYTYYDPSTCGLDFEAMIRDIQNIPHGEAILFHACAHNPTGVDPSPEQWAKISDVVRERNLLVLFDSAYQGFASGDTERDVQSVRQFLKDGHSIILAQSFAKNFGLYSSRVGTLSITGTSAEETNNILSQMKILIRPMYSNPPAAGAHIIHHVLSDADREAAWREEVQTMSSRIQEMRKKLVSDLADNGSTRNWKHITDQIGMFCFSGLSPDQVDLLATKHSVYLTRNGRISMAGVSSTNVGPLAAAIADVTRD
eukprot:CAMPEP_0201487378 /NCGR_PEP_ID=MMETSP0151_2-20130828/12672_1 /ASSEMBLY_ACC=CAM_ASM_000257 /TAXON_ID=200890 /ORGANISM="Paramoeba atlantica, Strain 621/1 / CCAP 1560/9" /LENGTH=424 /DNA_ID=CAMNT_0047872389 /DNA_START=55 /DNA_END=1329 /DNA_ORIENTATION=+